MKKNIIFIIIFILLWALLVAGCSQYTARNMGGTATEKLAPGVKLVNVTWKEKSLWITTRPMRPEEKPETYEFRESSVAGVLEGKIVLVESR